MDDIASFVERVEWEPENDKPGLMCAIDELCCGPIDSFHLERMDDGVYWIGIEKGDERQVIVISSATGRAAIQARTECDS